MSDLAARFRTALELHAAGVQLMRLNLRRRHPDESDDEIAARLREWLWRSDVEIPCHKKVEWPRS